MYSISTNSVAYLSLSFSWTALLISPVGLIIPSLLEKLLVAKIKIHISVKHLARCLGLQRCLINGGFIRNVIKQLPPCSAHLDLPRMPLLLLPLILKLA